MIIEVLLSNQTQGSDKYELLNTKVPKMLVTILETSHNIQKNINQWKIVPIIDSFSEYQPSPQKCKNILGYVTAFILCLIKCLSSCLCKETLE